MIYFACAIDQADPNRRGELEEEIQRLGDVFHQPVFFPGRAWRISPGTNPGSMIAGNQAMLEMAKLVVAYVDFEARSWGLPYELLTRAGQPLLLLLNGYDPEGLDRVRSLYLDHVIEQVQTETVLIERPPNLASALNVQNHSWIRSVLR